MCGFSMWISLLREMGALGQGNPGLGRLVLATCLLRFRCHSLPLLSRLENFFLDTKKVASEK